MTQPSPAGGASATVRDLIAAERRGEELPAAVQRLGAQVRPALRRMQSDWRRGGPIYNRLPQHLKRRYENVPVRDALRDPRFLRYEVVIAAPRAPRRTSGSNGRPAGRRRSTSRAGPDDEGEPEPPPPRRGHLHDVAAAVQSGGRP